MDESLIQMQELLSHQGDEIARLNDELIVQGKEIELLRRQVKQLLARAEAAADENAGIRPIDQETPPPHY